MFKLLFDSKNRNFSKLWVAQIISQFGDRVHQMALVGLAAQWSAGSASTLANLIAFTIIPVFIVQPFAGVFVDRWERKRTLFYSDIARSFLVLLIASIFVHWEMRLPVYGIVFLSFCFSRFYVPAKMSIIPELVDDDNLLKANSLVSTTGMIAFALGAAFGGFIVDWYGPMVGFYVDAVTFLVSALILLTIDKRVPRITREEVRQTKELMKTAPKSVWIEIKEGFHYIFTHREIRLVIDMLFALLAAAGAIYVVLIVFIQKTFGTVTKDLGVLAVSLGIGLFIGAILYGKWGEKLAWYKTIFLSLILGGIMLNAFAFLLSLFPNRVIGAGLAALLGMIVGPIFIASNTITHVVSDEKMRGKVFSALEIVIHLAFLVALLLSSWVSRYIEEMYILCGVGVMIALVGTIGLLRRQEFAKIA